MKKLILIYLVSFFGYSYIFSFCFDDISIDDLVSQFGFDQERGEDLLKLYNKTFRAEASKHPNFIVKDGFKQIPVIFKYYPELEKNIYYRQLGNLPTPVYKCKNLSVEIGLNIFIKRDDLTGDFSSIKKFGGNKVRKLEFLLADALKHNTQSVLTYGCAGSNHALATCFYTKELGLKPTAILMPQPNSKVLRRNLILQANNNSKLKLVQSLKQRSLETEYYCFKQIQKYKSAPYLIPTGGSCPIGVLGFINAAFELKEQIESKVCQEPDFLYLPVGSGGTYAGLLIGLKLAGLKTKLIGVTIEPEINTNKFVDKILELSNKTIELLRKNASNFNLTNITQEDITLLYDYCGQDYGLFTVEGIKAKKQFNKLENVELDGVYTAKAFAGLLVDIKTRVKPEDIVLFWNTFCSNSAEELLANEQIDYFDPKNYKQLPKAFHQYFLNSVQELDR